MQSPDPVPDNKDGALGSSSTIATILRKAGLTLSKKSLPLYSLRDLMCELSKRKSLQAREMRARMRVFIEQVKTNNQLQAPGSLKELIRSHPSCLIEKLDNRNTVFCASLLQIFCYLSDSCVRLHFINKQSISTQMFGLKSKKREDILFAENCFAILKKRLRNNIKHKSETLGQGYKGSDYCC